MSSEALPGLRLRKINVKQKESTVSAVATLPVAEEPVTPAGRLFMEKDMNCYILCTLAFENPINVEEFKKTFLVTLVNHKRFQSIIVSILFTLTFSSKQLCCPSSIKYRILNPVAPSRVMESKSTITCSQQ